MAELPPSIIAEWISEEIRNSEFILLRRVLEQVLNDNSVTKSEEETAELAEKLESIVLNKLREKQEEQLDKGIEPTFELDVSIGDTYIKSTNLIAKKTLGKLKRLSPLEFEDFCVLILSSLGASALRVGGTNDDGIDFIGYELPTSKFITPALNLSKPIVLGQAKRYPDRKIDVHDVRSFLGAALVKLDEIRREKSRYGLHAPAIFAFWTTSNFTDSALKFSSKSGIWILGGLALAQLAIKLDLEIAKEIIVRDVSSP
jgi:restriction endonuclease Mrr